MGVLERMLEKTILVMFMFVQLRRICMGFDFLFHILYCLSSTPRKGNSGSYEKKKSNPATSLFPLNSISTMKNTHYRVPSCIITS